MSPQPPPSHHAATAAPGPYGRPGALRKMHWHPNAGEWSFLRGRARVTVFAAESMASIFDYGPATWTSCRRTWAISSRISRRGD
ncbi:hypothetical protein EV126DRAFT_517399 [Verticillium dahliae]|nr:hypothetical protein EV126DRAFT_517399 [Verticillium dahliae]